MNNVKNTPYYRGHRLFWLRNQQRQKCLAIIFHHADITPAWDALPENNDERFVVIHIKNQDGIKVYFQELLKMLDGSFMTTVNTIVVPVEKMNLYHAMTHTELDAEIK